MAAFEDKAVRRGFIRKVYGIISAQLAVTSAVLAFFMFVVSPEVSYNQHALQQWLIGRDSLLVDFKTFDWSDKTNPGIT